MKREPLSSPRSKRSSIFPNFCQINSRIDLTLSSCLLTLDYIEITVPETTTSTGVYSTPSGSFIGCGLLYMQEDHRVHINLVTRADYIDYVSQALEVIETTVTRLQEEVQELRELLTLLADLASTDTFGQDIDRALAEPPAPSVPPPPAVAHQLPVTQPIQCAVRLSNREQLALA